MDDKTIAINTPEPNYNNSATVVTDSENMAQPPFAQGYSYYPPELHETQTENKKKNKKKKKLIIIASILIIIGLLGSMFSVWFFFLKDKEEYPVNLFTDGLTPVCKNGKWGYMNEDGELVIRCKYDYADSFHEGLAAVKKDNKIGYINTDDELVIDYKRFVDAHGFIDGMALVAVNDPDADSYLYGYINTDGKTVIDCKYTYLNFFIDGLAVAQNKDGKYGYIDKDGEVVIDFEYDYAGYFSEETGLALVAEGDTEDLEYFYIDKDGEVVIESEYDIADDFYGDSGLAAVGEKDKKIPYDSDPSDYYYTYKYGFINDEGDLKIDFKYTDTSYFCEGLCAVKNDKDKWGFIDEKGRLKIDYKYKSTTDFDNGICAVQNEKGKWGYIDKDGDVVIECKYDNEPELTNENGDILTLKENDRYIFVDLDGNKCIDKEFLFASSFYDDGYAIVVDKDKKYYVINSDGEQIGDKYDSINNSSYLRFCYVKDCYETSYSRYCTKHNTSCSSYLEDADYYEALYNKDGLCDKVEIYNTNNKLIGYATHEYDSNNREIRHSLYQGKELIEYSEYKYNEQGFISEITEYVDDEFSSRTTYEYDKNGNLTKEAVFYDESETPSRYTLYEYDKFGNETKESKYVDGELDYEYITEYGQYVDF